MNESMAFLLILVSCALHVAWNAISKGCRDREAYTWLVTFTGTIAVLPCFIIAQIWSPGSFGWRELAYAAASGLFESIYTIFLFWSYKHVDMSVAYPLGRGVAPVATLFLGILIGDAIKAGQIPAVATTLAGICCLSWEAHRSAKGKSPLGNASPHFGVLLALLTGCSIACYHIVDRGVFNVTAKPNSLVYLFAMHCFMLLFISIWMLPRRKAFVRIALEWKASPASAMAVGAVSFIAYFLVVLALQIGNATMVTAGRNIGIVLSIAVGALFLKERLSVAKAIGAVLVTAGVIMIFFAGNH